MADIKKDPQKNTFIFIFYVWIPYFVHFDSLGEKLQINILYNAQQPSVFDFHLGQYFLNKYPKTNIFAIFDTLMHLFFTIIPLANGRFLGYIMGSKRPKLQA